MSRQNQTRPGSAWWLLKHEIRLFWFDMGGGKRAPSAVDGGKSQGKSPSAKRGLSGFSIAIFALLAILMHVITWKILHHLPPLHGEPNPVILMTTGGTMFIVFSLMLSQGLSRSVRTLFERGDMDLLLSSPLSSSTIFTIRLTGIAVSIAAIYLVFLTPVAHVGLLMGQPQWLGIYPAVVGMAVCASSIAMLMTLALVKWIGVRRTRTVAQILGALVGASVFLGFQLFNNAGSRIRDTLMKMVTPLFQQGGILDEQSLIWLPAHALLGSLSGGVAFIAIALGLFAFTSRLSHRFFVLGVQQASGVIASGVISSTRKKDRAKKPASTAHRFRDGVVPNVLVKEWRLIARDPQLISQVLMQLLYMVPLAFVVFKNAGWMTGTAAAITYFSASLTGALIWITVSAEDAPDLLRASPAKSATIRVAKMLAAMIPVALLVSPLLLWMLWHQLGLGILSVVTCGGAMVTVVLIYQWHSKPGTRSQFSSRGTGVVKANLMAALTNLAWAIVALLGWTSMTLIPLGFIAVVLIFASLLRTERDY
jgi:ABC-2 type transport system permease protein